MRLEDITTEGVERWAAGLTVGGRMNNRTKLKILTVLHGVMKRAKRVWKLPRPSGPDELWVADLSYLRCWEGSGVLRVRHRRL